MRGQIPGDMGQLLKKVQEQVARTFPNLTLLVSVSGGGYFYIYLLCAPHLPFIPGACRSFLSTHCTTLLTHLTCATSSNSSTCQACVNPSRRPSISHIAQGNDPFASDVEEEANAHFQKIYSEAEPIEEVCVGHAGREKWE